VRTVVDGQDVILRYLRSQLTGWTSVVWAPIAVINAPTDRLWRTLTAASLIALLASSALAYLFARPFARLMDDTLRNVSVLGTVSDIPPIKSLLDEGSIISGSVQRVNQQLLERQRENEEGSALLQTLLENVPEGITIVGGPDLKIVANSGQALEWLGRNPDKPQSAAAEGANDLSIRNLDGSIPAAEQMPLYRASRRGESIKGLQLILERTDGRKMPIEMSVNPVRDRSGKIIGAVSCWRDITERKQSEQNLRLISRELTHRAKNLLTVVLGIAKQTAHAGMNVDDFLSVFAQRIQGLGASHDLLTNSDWGGAQLEELVTSQLAPFGGVDGVRIKTKGPNVLLKNDVLQTMGLALHELGTNAVKYGALGADKGTVEVSWRIDSSAKEPRLKMMWKERGGPPVRKPPRKGFGHNITVRSLARVISGEVKIEFAKAGVVWTLDAPLAALAFQSPGIV
jgi:two-component sensor histidine kinase/PAS domain-containing protein